eukprot:TRINITY_DN6369_c0_g1_i1.p1 TRINITY_DN6369_c0_g1~~TRINITY_DN6369_c0_g1_i1.p1  ORF type:complete len:260 (-),score=47.66 TRINITY_DN6369_c0_g1_i1:566-1345(-)
MKGWLTKKRNNNTTTRSPTAASSSSNDETQKKKKEDEDDNGEDYEDTKYYLAGVPELIVPSPHSRSVWEIKELEDGNIASCSDDGTFKIWSRSSGECLLTYTHNMQIWRFVEWKPRQFVFGDYNGKLSMLSVRRASEEDSEQLVVDYTFKDQHENARGVVSIVKLNEETIATGSFDCTVKVWQVETGECIQTLRGHFDSVRTLAKTTDGAILSGSRDTFVNVWRLARNNTENDSSSVKNEYRLECTLVGQMHGLDALWS